MLGTKNVRYGGVIKARKKPAKSHYFKDCAGQKFVATILVIYVTILTELFVSSKLDWN